MRNMYNYNFVYATAGMLMVYSEADVWTRMSAQENWRKRKYRRFKIPVECTQRYVHVAMSSKSDRMIV